MSDDEDVFYEGNYNSDNDKEWLPPEEQKNKECYNSSISDNNEENNINDNQVLVDVEAAAPSPEFTRKRKRNPAQWKVNERKRKRERGEEYISARKKVVPAKSINLRKNCTKCIYKCTQILTLEEQLEVFVNYYTLNNQAKKMFIISSCEVCEPERRRKGKNKDNSKKKKTIKYFLKIKDRKVQVCKKYFLSTLDVSHKTVYLAVNKRNSETNTPKQNSQGCHTKKKISSSDFQNVKEHINSFPRIESHYCRADTRKEYLEGNLSVTRMYNLYVQQMTENNAPILKLSQYRYIFCNNFNIFFHKPKKDRCSLCELNRITADDEQENNTGEEYLKHIKEKEAARKERQLDRETDKAVLTFDLQNVLSCPKAEISSFYYKTKMSVYNLTAHLSIDGQVYCSLWPEVLMGRKGNDIASTLIKILKQIILDHPNIVELTLWSDSCVPQNRNSVISYAIGHFLSGQTQLEKITLKYSTPGHSCVQEIDSVHSVIERFLNKVEYYSPVSLLRILLKENSKKPYKILQMRSNDFFDYQSSSSSYSYNDVPYTKVSSLEIKKMLLKIGYKTSHDDKSFTIINLKRNSRTVQECIHEIFPEPKKINSKPDFPVSKKESIKSMLIYMPKQDQEYYKAVIPDQNKEMREILPINNERCIYLYDIS